MKKKMQLFRGLRFKIVAHDCLSTIVKTLSINDRSGNPQISCEFKDCQEFPRTGKDFTTPGLVLEISYTG